MKTLWVVGAALLLWPAPGQALMAPQDQVLDTFPHALHEGMFPLCTGCHGGVPTGELERFYPDAATCVRCHELRGVEGVTWSGREPGTLVSNLAFAHEVHGAAVSATGDAELVCATCHTAEGGGRMDVDPLSADVCVSCHGHPAQRHTQDAECATCHVPLAESGLPLERIDAMRPPRDHFSGAFAAGAHGAALAGNEFRCSTCHTRQLCTACHVDADRSEIQSFPAAPADMRLPEARSRYPTPESHASEDFEWEHGALSEETSCATCHTRDDCASCHLPPLPAAAGELRRRSEVVAPGVGLSVDVPSSHESPHFLGEHPALAIPDMASCQSCHTSAFCVECHEGPGQPEFHPPNFVAEHAASAWNQTAECSTCHDAQAFCRSCHVQSGFAADGRLGPGYHDAEPLWLLRHAQAARQSLESCASCHSQRNCLQCHSTVGAFQVNPHGRDFDAKRAQEKNPGVCFACHSTNPIGGGGP
jgi:hypothetical protein